MLAERGLDAGEFRVLALGGSEGLLAVQCRKLVENERDCEGVR
jgi:hypothetical protein